MGGGGGERWGWGWGLEEDAAALHEEGVEGLLDGFADLVGDVEDQHRVVGGAVGEVVGADRLAELNQPLRRERDQAERSQQREERVTGMYGTPTNRASDAMLPTSG